MRMTKIVATIGPASWDEEVLLGLREAGMDVARINGSHGTLEEHEKLVETLRRILPELPILLDMPGRKVRTGRLVVEPSFEVGDRLTLTAAPGHDGREKVPLDVPVLPAGVKVGAEVLADDGRLRFTVVEIDGDDIVCQAEAAGTLRSRKGVHLQGTRSPKGSVGDADRRLLDFASRTALDYVGLSFVESVEDVDEVRSILGDGGPRIVAKIETQRGIDALGPIASRADVLMVDRGDLSLDTGLEQLGLLQKQIISGARAHARPVIVATEMLQTMIEEPVPSKAEVTDITNAILDGCGATMLSGETAVGRHPVEAVRLMAGVASAAEAHLQDVLDQVPAGGMRSIPDVMSDAAALVCRSLPITKIVAVTISGYAARMVACHRPRQPILAVSNDARAARSFNLLPGTTGVHVDIPFSRTGSDHIVGCLEALWKTRLIDETDAILVTAVVYPRSGNRMNLVQTHHVADLRESLGW